MTAEVAQQCGLPPIGRIRVQGVGGTEVRPLYLAGIRLPNHVQIPRIRVCEAETPGAEDILTGMDIIGAGDFAVSNFGGKTVFTYRHPSVARIDFVDQPDVQPVSTPKVGRNARCPCAIGKKYKNCCGAA